MNICRTKKSLSALSAAWHRAGETVALVPTMGFLHEGHLSLVRLAKRRADRVVVSVFVNPTQFGPNEDFAQYPRDEKRDFALLRAEGVDAVFAPTPEEMYGADATVSLVESKLSKVMCGAFRPIHFAGVLTVVLKLFNASRADVAVFGRKDAQQLAVIRRMVRDLDVPVKIVGAPLVREKDGLALSSRNTYLSPAEHARALALHEALDAAEADYRAGRTDPKRAVAAQALQGDDLAPPRGSRHSVRTPVRARPSRPPPPCRRRRDLKCRPVRQPPRRPNRSPVR